MNRTIILCTALASLLAFGSCKEKKRSDFIITHKPLVVKQGKPSKTGDASVMRSVAWRGSSYTLSLTLKADPELPLASDGVKQYYDNRVVMRLMRGDGSIFFDRTFTKSDFSKYVDNAYLDGGALLGIVFDHADASRLYFAVTVGNPDKSSEEFMPLTMSINTDGEIMIEKAREE